MRLIHKAVFIALSSALSAITYASTSSTPTPAVLPTATTTSSTSVAAPGASQSSANLQAQLKQLADQINQLNDQIQSKTDRVINRPKLAKAEQSLNNGYAHMATSKGVLFEHVPAPTFALTVLESREHFSDEDMLYGGYFEQDSQYWTGNSIPATNTVTGNNYNYKTGSDLDLTTLKFDNLALLNPWTAAFISFEGNNLTTDSPTLGVEKAFLLFGRLQDSPLYALVGKNYLPYGAFAGGGPWTSPLTKSYFRPDETTQAMAGYYQDGLSTGLSAFNNSSTTNPRSQVSDFTYEVQYSPATSTPLTYSVGAGYLNDMRATTTAIGSAANVQTGRLPAYDLNASLNYLAYGLSGEYNRLDHTVAGNNSLGQAWNTTASYTPVLWGQETSFALSYSGTVGLANVPVSLDADLNAVPNVIAGIQNSWVASISREVIENVFLGLEEATVHTYTGQNSYATTLDVSMYF